MSTLGAAVANMTQETMKEKAVDLVKEAHPEATAVTLDRTIENFHGGWVFIVRFTDALGTRENTVYFKDDRPTLYYCFEEILPRSSRSRPDPEPRRPSRDFSTPGSTGGVIGCIQVAAVCFLTIVLKTAPDILANTLLAFLIFHFGSKMNVRTSNSKE